MVPMKNIRLTVAYDGTDFCGWQKTKMGSSIEETLEEVLIELLQEKVTLQAASRTDAGVHAEGQVVTFNLVKPIAPDKLRRGLNALLPKTITVTAVEQVPEPFHPTLDACGKEYRYALCTGPWQLPHHRHFSWHVPYSLDLEAMRKGAKFFLGTHDFTSFCNQRKDLRYPDKRRTLVQLEIEELDGGRIAFNLVGNSFLYKMVRNIVGTLVFVGRGKLKADAIPAILEAKKRVAAGMTAPAHGLCLKRIFYEDMIFP